MIATLPIKPMFCRSPQTTSCVIVDPAEISAERYCNGNDGWIGDVNGR